MPRYFKEGRKYDEYRFIKCTQRKKHVEILLQANDEEYFTGKRAKCAEKVATTIARSFGKVELVNKSELRYHTTDKKVIVFDENNNVSEEYETLVYQVFYFNRWVKPRRRNQNGKR